MPFNHNDHYHALLLREIPKPCRNALDVGCGTGRFAQKLALRGIQVHAIDTDGNVIADAEKKNSTLKPPQQVHFEQADIKSMRLEPNTYDYIACLASIHHVPFEIVNKLRASLTENGVLVILGCYRETTFLDHTVSLIAVPVNAIFRTIVFFWEKWKKGGDCVLNESASASVSSPDMTLPEIQEKSAEILPGRSIRHLLFWRYFLIFHNTNTD
ncbi:class I SAM-dependent methyltransferase [Nocardiopsis kunsanensis]|uniref:class I SAM-dependent methyltransferase n=1 Tax=Nocardiopsis kunsanensis TaxID=141693 RepID=UPI000A039DF2|nr:class I SAM-dependent methyltransferase [Nocardiopsis kunsanensis]